MIVQPIHDVLYLRSVNIALVHDLHVVSLYIYLKDFFQFKSSSQHCTNGVMEF